MKKKDIISVVISVTVLGVSLYFLYGMLFPSSSKNVAPAANQTQGNTTKSFTGEIDETTLNQVKQLSDYGEAPLDNIGRVNPFGPIN